MPSSDRLDQRRAHQSGLDNLAADTRGAGEKAGARLRASAPSQHFDPSEPWDAQSAEALTRLYESGEAYDDCQGEGQRARRWRPQQSATPPPHRAPAAEPQPTGDSAWLDARLAEMAQRLQDSLAGLNPDKSLAPLCQRLDAIEQRFGEALTQVAQRSDLDGLKLIEANVLELAAHFEATRGRLDRLEGIDEQVRDVARRLEDGGHQRLAELEQLLQGYITEWRRSDERTANALNTLEEAVDRVGESVEAVEAQKPVPDLSMFTLATSELGSGAADRDPLAQAYADTARALEQPPLREPLDAADYTPRPGPAADRRPLPPPLPTGAPSATGAGETKPGPVTLQSPAFRAASVRAKLAQTQMLRVDDPPLQALSPARKPEDQPRSAPQRARTGLLLAAGFTVFASGGFLLVDALMTTAAHRASSGIERTARPIDPRAGEEPVGSADIKGPTTMPMGPDQDGKAPAPPPQPSKAPADGQTGLSSPAPSPTLARVEALGSSIAAMFRAKAPPAAQPQAELVALPPKDTPPAVDEGTAMAIATLPMTIGPASLRQAALRGEAAAQVEIAARFATGLGVPRDLQEAVRWYGRAAAQGMALAQYRLGMFHERGWGTPPDAERARVWYQRAAEQGNIKAMHNLAVLSVSGGRSDYAAAAKWFAKAADMGLADSQFNLAVLHQSGLGVPMDLRLAYKWLALAARTGDREASSRIAEVKAQLAAGDVQEIDALVASWRARAPDPAVNEQSALSMAP